MELNDVKLFAQNAAAINKSQGVKSGENNDEAEFRDNRPADQQFSADEVLNFMAGAAVDFKAKVNSADKKEDQETRIAGFMADFEEAYGFAKDLGFSDRAIEQIFDRI